MGDINIKLCRLCLNEIECNNYEVIKEVTKEIFDILLLNLIMDDRNVQVMCSVCFKKLLAAFEFKSTCLYTEDILFPYINRSETSSLDLREIYLKEKGKQQLVSISQKICRLCMEPVKRNFKSIQEVEVIMFQKFLPEMNFYVIMDPIACNDCRVSLSIHTEFIKNCLDVEKILKNGETGQSSTLFLKNESIDIKYEEPFLEEMCIESPSNNVANDKGQDSGHAVFEENMENDRTFKGKLADLSSQHEIRHTSNKDFSLKLKCDKCKFTAKCKSHLRRHELVHKKSSQIQMYKCKECKCEYKRKDTLESHQWIHRRHLQVQKYKCNECTFETKYWRGLERHYLTHRDPSQVQMYKCDKCKFETVHKGNLATHCLIHRDPLKVQTYKCHQCKYETVRKSNLVKHLLIHRDPLELQRYKCQQCKFETVYKRSLAFHQLRHKDPSQVRMYKCCECNFETRHKQNLERHQLSHKDSKEVQMYKCKKCSYKTKRKDHLQSHQLKFKCKFF